MIPHYPARELFYVALNAECQCHIRFRYLLFCALTHLTLAVELRARRRFRCHIQLFPAAAPALSLSPDILAPQQSLRAARDLPLSSRLFCRADALQQLETPLISPLAIERLYKAMGQATIKHVHSNPASQPTTHWPP